MLMASLRCMMLQRQLLVLEGMPGCFAHSWKGWCLQDTKGITWLCSAFHCSSIGTEVMAGVSL
jgi:hypothetical protein